MVTMGTSAPARNISRVLDSMEQGGDPIVILRNRRPVAMPHPGPTQLLVMESVSEPFGVLPKEEGEAWIQDLRSFDRPASKELQDLWTAAVAIQRSGPVLTGSFTDFADVPGRRVLAI